MDIQDTVIAQLREAIETVADRKMRTPKDFDFLSDAIFEKLHQKISTTTLKRLWGYLSEPVTPRTSTLDLLAQFIGVESWEVFQQQAQKGKAFVSKEESKHLEPASHHEAPYNHDASHSKMLRFAFIALPILAIIALVAFFLHTSSADDAPIDFADPAVKALCVAHWDTNGDGELSLKEAAQVQDLKDVFREDTTITTFDELQYFTGLTYIGEKAFTQCSNLTSIILPSQVKSIYTHAFSQCTRLIAITIPDGVTSIGYSAFYLCNSLTSLAIPSSVTSINEWNSFAMANLKYITVDENNTVYDSRNHCNAIIETATNKLVSGCSTTVIPKDVTTIGTSAFYSCYSLESIDIPANITQIGTTAFAWSLGLKSVTCHWDKPISFGENAFDHISGACTLTVPPGTRDAYIAAGWTEEIFKGGVIEASE